MVSVNALAAVSFATAEWWAAAITVALFLLVFLLVGTARPPAATAGGKRTPRLLRPFLGGDGRVSTSQTVALGWTAVVVYVLFALIIVNPKSWSDALQNLSPTYLLLLGFPYASLVLAKATVTSRMANGTLDKPRTDQPATLAQLFTNDAGTTDAFDVQYVVFNVVAMVFVIVQFGRTSLTAGFPEIPDGLILLTGGPAAVYLTNKFMPGGAPAIFSVSPGQVRVGQSFAVNGQNLVAPGATEPPAVRVGAMAVPSESVSGFTPSSVVAVAPDLGADLGRPVDVAVKGASGAQAVITGVLQVLGRVPVLDGAGSGVAHVGDDVVLRGEWSAEEASDLTVLVDAGVIGPTSHPGANTVTFTVPPLSNLDGQRSVSVKVKLGSEVSNAIPMLISPAASSETNGGGAGVRMNLGATR